MENYRKFYADIFNINIPKEYEIHHLDCNRKNNELDNLLLIPKELHTRYHAALYNVTHAMGNNGLATRADQHALLGMQCAYINELCKVVNEIGMWVLYKEINHYPKEWYKCQHLE